MKVHQFETGGLFGVRRLRAECGWRGTSIRKRSLAARRWGIEGVFAQHGGDDLGEILRRVDQGLAGVLDTGGQGLVVADRLAYVVVSNKPSAHGRFGRFGQRPLLQLV